MANVDAAALAQQALLLGLVNESQLQDYQDDRGRITLSPEGLMRAMERKGHLTPWQTNKLLKGDKEGYFLGNYKLLYKIASGSFGRVFRAEDPRNGVIVAVKVLRNRWSEDAHSIELFEREAKVGQFLRHPNIVSILSMGKDPKAEQYFIVMEFVEGGNLRDFLAIRKKIDPPEALRIMEDITMGMAYAFARGISHRDMKLSNVLISTQGVAKLVDFGLAGIHDTGAKEDDKMDRTVDYAGLEMATNVKPGDIRSDIYFMGCVLYELLTGRPPLLLTKDRQQRMLKSRYENVPPISKEEVNAPYSVFQLVENMMSLTPHRRYQNPQQLLDAIRHARRDLGDPSVHAVGHASGAQGPECTIFVVEKNERLQEVLRDQFKKMGYRVLMTIDPATAIDRFKQRAYDVLLIDAGAVGKEGVVQFERFAHQAEVQKLNCAGILILSEDQADWAKKIKETPRMVVMIRPVNGKQLAAKLRELAPPPAKPKVPIEEAGQAG